MLIKQLFLEPNAPLYNVANLYCECSLLTVKSAHACAVCDPHLLIVSISLWLVSCSFSQSHFFQGMMLDFQLQRAIAPFTE